MRKGTLLLLVTVSLVACAMAWDAFRGSAASPRESQASEVPHAPNVPDVPLPPFPLKPPAQPVRFLAWGDAGHGNAIQRAVAEAAAEVCAAEGCTFALQLGDNVYPHGVDSASDPQFDEKFEQPYEPLDLPFYTVLGNHDVARGNGDYQVAYALRDDRASDKWRMPARYYDFREGDVQVVVMDLTALEREDSEPAAAAAQIAWLSTVWNEDARWRVAVSHFPYLSNGQHGDAGHYDGVPGRGMAILEVIEGHVCGKADIYLAGHDHDLEWLRSPPACEGTELVVSGAVAEVKPLRPEAAHPTWFSVGGTPGFFWFEAEGDTLVGRAYAADGAVLFERTVQK